MIAFTNAHVALARLGQICIADDLHESKQIAAITEYDGQDQPYALYHE